MFVTGSILVVYKQGKGVEVWFDPLWHLKSCHRARNGCQVALTCAGKVELRVEGDDCLIVGDISADRILIEVVSHKRETQLAAMSNIGYSRHRGCVEVRDLIGLE